MKSGVLIWAKPKVCIQVWLQIKTCQSMGEFSLHLRNSDLALGMIKFEI